MAELLADIGFGLSGTSGDYVLDGWGEVEPTHRWTVGAQSHMRLPITKPGPDCVVVIDAMPWLDESCLRSQTVMLAINERLLSTIQIHGHRVMAFALPSGMDDCDAVILSFCHLNCHMPRLASGLDHSGRALGLLVTAIRIFRLPGVPCPFVARSDLPGSLTKASLEKSAVVATGMPVAELMMGFESLGHNCEFGLIQRSFGAEPLGLLRFASVVTHTLVDGLMAGFAGVGAPETTRIFVSDPPELEYKVHEKRYYTWYSTGRKEADTTADAVLAEQCRKLTFLQRKFIEDLYDGNKIYVLTRAERLTEAEALAVFCALQLKGPNSLLWTTHGDPHRTGQVVRLMPGFLRGELGLVDSRYYATTDAWLRVLANAFLITRDTSSNEVSPPGWECR